MGAADAGRPDDFPRLVQLAASLDPSQSSSRAVRTLFRDPVEARGAARLGRPRRRRRLPGADAAATGLPADLRDAPSGPDFDALPFTPLYLLDDEFAAEIANRTMHGVMHLGWVPDGTGGYRAQMAVYVKPNGLLGTAYMAAIRPFRHLLVYPPMLRRSGGPGEAGTHSASRLGAVT